MAGELRNVGPGHDLTDEERAKGRETQRRNREERRAAMEQHFDALSAVEKAVEALVKVAEWGEPGARVSAADKILNQLVGRPPTVIEGAEDKPIRIVVESVAQRVKHVRDA